jgi:hypothetical protein
MVWAKIKILYKNIMLRKSFLAAVGRGVKTTDTRDWRADCCGF